MRLQVWYTCACCNIHHVGEQSETLEDVVQELKVKVSQHPIGGEGPTTTKRRKMTDPKSPSTTTVLSSDSEDIGDEDLSPFPVERPLTPSEINTRDRMLKGSSLECVQAHHI